jgi:hypothetical protein
MAEPRGAGRGGGLLFLAVGAFVAYLAVSAVDGAARIVLVVVFAVALGLLALNVVRRR